jgi:alginate O-acetyltransferase complex protein AlgI
LGFKLMDNFNIPFKASSVADYWRRWHISLSTWLLDYLFKPLQMKFRRWRIYGSALAVFITFLAVGIWHGANWTFVYFGLCHSTFLTVGLLTQKSRNAFYDKIKIRDTKFHKFFRIFFTFHILMFTAILFRAPSMQFALDMVHQIFTYFHGAVFLQWVPAYWKVAALVLLGYVLHFIPRKVDYRIQEWIIKMPVVFQALLLAVTIWIVIQAESAQLQPVIYFNF